MFLPGKGRKEGNPAFGSECLPAVMIHATMTLCCSLIDGLFSLEPLGGDAGSAEARP